VTCEVCGRNDTQVTVVNYHRDAYDDEIRDVHTDAVDLVLCVECYEAKTGHPYEPS
jgi:hypothetical protein